jgi:tRNA pseudouridine32 synthase/23S rRNA pseudouridine746 synthase
MPPILFRNEGFVVLDKPSGLPVHPSRAGGPSVEDFFPALSRRRDGPWLAHRLDRDTAGCLVIALRKSALLEAQAAFAEGRAEKTYWAVVHGRPAANSGRIDLPLAKVTTDRAWRMQSDPTAPQAVTDWALRGATDGLAWLELHPLTGRTHQVRAHCAALGCPVLGDPIYGDGDGKLMLLARAITLNLTPPVSATAPVPPHMEPPLRRLGWKKDETPRRK